MEGKRFAWEKSFLNETTTGSEKLFGYECIARNTIEIGSIDILSGGRANKLEELFPLTGFCKSLDMSEEIYVQRVLWLEEKLSRLTLNNSVVRWCNLDLVNLFISVHI